MKSSRLKPTVYRTTKLPDFHFHLLKPASLEDARGSTLCNMYAMQATSIKLIVGSHQSSDHRVHLKVLCKIFIIFDRLFETTSPEYPK